MATLLRNDAEIRQDVLDEMEYDPAVMVHHIAVAVQGGTVTLTGVVDSCGTRLAAEQVAWRVLGVREVRVETVVDPTLLGMPNDAVIAANVRHRLDTDVLVPKCRIRVSVDNGVVTLSETVDSHIEREAAREEAAGAQGVRDLNLQIEIEPPLASPGELEAVIQKALARSAQVDAANIRIAVDGGHVTLSGAARSYAERRAAEDAVWRAPGVTQVTDNIAIQPYREAGRSRQAAKAREEDQPSMADRNAHVDAARQGLGARHHAPPIPQGRAGAGYRPRQA
jgi:osmotically-inducible protein OsmY